MLWVLDIVSGVASNIVYAILERLLQQFRRIGRMAIDPQDEMLLDAVKELPDPYKVTALSRDVQIVNHALSIRPIAPENFSGLKTPLQRLLASCALLAMAQLDTSVHQELERIDQRLCELSDDLGRRLKELECLLSEMYQDTNTRLGDVDQELAAIRRDIRHILDDIDRLLKDADADLRKDLVALDAKFRSLDKDLVRQLRQTDGQVSDLCQSVAELKNGVEVVKTEIRALRKEQITRRKIGVAVLAAAVLLVIGSSFLERGEQSRDYHRATARQLSPGSYSRGLAIHQPNDGASD